MPTLNESLAPPAPRVAALCNEKGGVGKTTSACLLARAVSVLGLRVLVVDLDPQGNTTRTLSVDLDALPELGVAHVLNPHGPAVDLSRVVVSSIWPGVDLAPSASRALLREAAGLLSQAQFGRESALARALEPLIDGADYDLVIVDTPPDLGHLLINALVAADAAVPVTEPEEWSADGLGALLETLSLVGQHHNPGLLRFGPLVNQVQRNKRHERIVGTLRAAFPHGWVAEGDLIPQRTAIMDALHAGEGLDEGDARLRVIGETFARFGRRLLTLEGGVPAYAAA